MGNKVMVQATATTVNRMAGGRNIDRRCLVLLVSLAAAVVVDIIPRRMRPSWPLCVPVFPMRRRSWRPANTYGSENCLR